MLFFSRKLSRAISTLCLLIAVFACADVSADNTKASSLLVSPQNVALNSLRDRTQLLVTAQLSNISGPDNFCDMTSVVCYVSKNPAIATVSSTGKTTIQITLSKKSTNASVCRPARSLACACERELETNFSQALKLIGGEILEKKLRHDTGTVAKLAKGKLDDKTLIQKLFLSTISRYPNKVEAAQMVSLLKESKNRRSGIEDILWALINHREFLFQH